MKNLIQKFAPFAVMAGLAGCVSAPVAQEIAKPQKPVAIEIPKEEGISLRNGYRAESKLVETDLKIITGILLGKVKVNLVDGKYVMEGQFSETSAFPKTYDEVCRIVSGSDKYATLQEATDALRTACRNSTKQ